MDDTESQYNLDGYIYLERKIQGNKFWHSEPFTRGQAWVDLLLLANHTDSSYFLRGIEINVKRGELARSEETLAARWKWSKGKVRRFLKLLKTVQQIDQQNNNIINKIVILNYNSFQNKVTKQTNKRTPDSKPNGKHISNDKECISNDKEIDRRLLRLDEFLKRELEKERVQYNKDNPAQSIPDSLYKQWYKVYGESEDALMWRKFEDFVKYWLSDKAVGAGLKKDWITTWINNITK